MKRKEIMSDVPEEFEDRLREVVDYVEEKFKEIENKLSSITSIDHLDQVNDAYQIAESVASDLY